MLDKQDSNQVGLYMAREVITEDGYVLPDNPVFRTREPNSFERFGGSYTMVARNPFNASRQNKKGSTTDLDTAGGWNEDVTQNNLFDLLEGFFFAAMRRKATQAVTSIDVADDNDYVVVDGSGFPVGSIVFADGFDRKANEGAKHVTASVGGVITVAEVLAAEVVAVGAPKTLTRVGNRFGAGDCKLSVAGNMVMLTFTAYNPDGLGLIPGEWVFVGGDIAASRFDNVRPGYARVNVIDGPGKIVYFDKFTSVVPEEGDIGAGKSIELYYGFFVKNEDDEDLIVKSSFTAERPLGKDDDGRQSDNLQNFVLNQMTWNSPLSNKPTIDVTGIGLGYETRTGSDGMLSKMQGATILRALGEEAFNTSRNVFRIRLSMMDPVTGRPLPLFARCTEWTMVINNNVTAAKSQGTLGGFDTTVGQFDVSTTITAYFNSVEAIRAIKDNEDCTFDAIYAKHNAGIVVDLPLVSTGGGELTVAQNQPIMLPLTNNAAESVFGHTALINFFPYLPSAAMAKGG